MIWSSFFGRRRGLGVCELGCCDQEGSGRVRYRRVAPGGGRMEWKLPFSMVVFYDYRGDLFVDVAMSLTRLLGQLST